MLLVIGVHLITVWRKRTDKPPLLTLEYESTTYLAGNILHIHFAVGIGIFRNADKTNPTFEKFIVDVLLDDDVPRKYRLIFTQNDVNMTVFAVIEQSIELGAVAVNAALAVVTINIIDFPVTFSAIISKHGFTRTCYIRIMKAVIGLTYRFLGHHTRCKDACRRCS